MVSNISAAVDPARMTCAEKDRIRAAAFLAPALYPRAVGIVLQRELLAWDEFGYRFGPGSLVAELVEHLMDLAVHDAPQCGDSGGDGGSPWPRGWAGRARPAHNSGRGG